MIHGMNRIVIFSLISLANLLCGSAFADVHLPAIISDNMVLQQGCSLTIWGWADLDERITVEIDGQNHTCITPDDKTWRVVLDPLKPGGPYQMKVTGKNVVEVNNILAGEVRLISLLAGLKVPFNESYTIGMRIEGVPEKSCDIVINDNPPIRLTIQELKESAGEVTADGKISLK